MAGQYLGKAPSAAHFRENSIPLSAAERALLPHPKTIIVGSAIVPFVPEKKAWAAPYNLYSHPAEQWIHSRAEAQELAERINAILRRA